MSSEHRALRLRSVLFVPGDRPDLVEKAPRSRPDAVVLDLEDAVSASHKATARSVVARAALTLRAAAPQLTVLVRVNAVPTDWFRGDVQAVAASPIDGIVLPKVEQPEHVLDAAAACTAAARENLPIVAGIETARGVHSVAELLVPPVAALYFGAEDYIADVGGRRTSSNGEVQYARGRIVLAARLAAVHALDQVVAAFEDVERFEREAEEARALGYHGKLCIHPSQVAIANRVLTPSPEEIERARSIIQAFEVSQASGSGVIAFEGQMIDEPLARQARAVLSLATSLGAVE